MDQWMKLTMAGAVGVVVLASASEISFKEADESPQQAVVTKAKVEPEQASRDANEAAEHTSEREAPAPIRPDAAMAYTADMYPTLVAKFGSTIPIIERERSAAAQITAGHQSCDEVTNVQITSRSTSGNRRYYADCQNRSRFYFDADTIAAGYPAGLQTWDDIVSDGLETW